MRGILLQIGYFEKKLSKRFKKVNFFFLSNRIPYVCHSHVPVCHAYVTRMYSYVILTSLVCTRISSVCHSYVFVVNLYILVRYSYVTCMYYQHVIRMSLVCHPYINRMCSYVIRMSLVCTRMSSMRHLYVLVCHPYATLMYSYVLRLSIVCGFTMNHII